MEKVWTKRFRKTITCRLRSAARPRSARPKQNTVIADDCTFRMKWLVLTMQSLEAYGGRIHLPRPA